MEFKSKSGKICSASQYIAELVCTRYAKKNNIPMLDKFWNQPELKPFYTRQISLAHGLIKLFNAESIVIALNSKDGNWIFSLATKKLVDIIKLIESKKVNDIKKIEYEQSKEISFEEKAVQEVAQIRASKKSILEDLE